MMKVKNIKTISDAQRYCEGLANDFETGIIDKGEFMIGLRDYTYRIESFIPPDKQKYPVKKRPCKFEVLLYKENPPGEHYDTPGEHYTVEGNGLFIDWASDVELDGKEGALGITVGLVEDMEGQVYSVHPSNIKFLDR